MDVEDAILMSGLKAHRVESFELTVSRYAPRLLAVAARIGGPDDAEDAVQESLISAWQAIDQLNEPGSLYSWLRRIVVNHCLAKMRRAGYRRETTGEGLTHRIETTTPIWYESGISMEKQIATRRVIDSALKRIPEELRIVLLLRDVEGMSSQETAERLGISDALARQRLHRARTAMAELLRPELCDGPGLTCGGKIDLLFDYLDTCLPDNLSEDVTRHVRECGTCSRLAAIYRESIRFPADALKKEHEEILPTGFSERLMRRIATSSEP